MLVYANHLSFRGGDAEQAILKGIGGWLKEQLGFGLHPEQLKQDGEFNGYRGDQRSWLRIHACYDGEPALCAWVLKHAAGNVRGRQWIVEVGVKRFAGVVEVSCLVKTDEYSTLVASPVTPSQPRVIRYIVSNILTANDAAFTGSVPGESLKTVGDDDDSYRAFVAEIERRDRNGAIVLVSATREGEYLLNPAELQKTLIGLAQVVQVSRESNSYTMADILGKQWSAWGGAVNVLSIPSATGLVRFRYFLPDAIRAWGDEAQRTCQVLAWVTGNTNIPRLRVHVRPEGVMQLSMRRRMEQMRAKSREMDVAQLRHALEDASKQVAEQERFFAEIAEENAGLQTELARYKSDLDDASDEFRKREFQIQSLKDQLSCVGSESRGAFDPDALVKLAAQKEDPSPQQCIEVIEQVYGDRCAILESARSSAKRMSRFGCGRELLDLLVRLVTTYREGLMNGGGDSNARQVFGKNEYAAKESELVMATQSLRRRRVFEYNGAPVEMFRHLKIGIGDDVTKTIRVHFHWDADREKIVLGYCGEHLPVSSR
jgi:hypothetical protein